MDCDDVMNHEIETCDEEEQFCLRLKDGSELTLACAADPPREVTLDSSISISKGSLKKGAQTIRFYLARKFSKLTVEIDKLWHC